MWIRFFLSTTDEVRRALLRDHLVANLANELLVIRIHDALPIGAREIFMDLVNTLKRDWEIK